jgi:hypothetical protein
VCAGVEEDGRERMTEAKSPVRATVNVAATDETTSSDCSPSRPISPIMCLVTGTPLTARRMLPNSAEERLFG